MDNHVITPDTALPMPMPMPLPPGQASAPAPAATMEAGADAPAAAPAAMGARLGFIIAALVALLLMIALGLANIGTPAPSPVSAPAAQFSSGRAMQKLVRIAAEPHATGTAANAAVRDYLVKELEALGYQPHVQSALGAKVSPDASIAGYAHNIVVRVPGQAGGKALMLSAHYDSVPTGAGAADDGASVAAILETLRALKTGAPLKNDLIVLFSDAEEAGMLGAEAFAASHPWFGGIGLALNFEYRGNSGRMLMFETSKDNGKLVDALADVPGASGSSLMYEVYRMLPNDTDLSAFKRAGMVGMNFAAIERPTSYHTQLDRPEMLNEGSMQHQGEIMLALARHFGNADLHDLKSANRIYFDMPGAGLVHYPASLAMPLAATLAVLFAAVLVLGVRSGALRTGRVIVAAILLPLTALLFGVGATFVWAGIAVLHPAYGTLMDIYNGGWYMAAFVALTVGAFTLVQFRLQRWFVVMELAMGATLVWVAALLMAALIVPGASFLFTWPLVPLLPAFAWLLSARGRAMQADTRLLLLVATAAPAVFLFAPLLRTLFIALTTQLAGVPLFLLVLLLGMLYPLAASLKRRMLFPALCLLGGVAMLVAGSVTGGVSSAQPRANTLFYAEDGASGQGMWLSNDATLDSWNGPLFGDKPVQRKVPELFGDRPRQYWAAPAPSLRLAPPVMEVVSDVRNGAARDITLRIKSPRGAPQLKIYGEGVEVLHATLDGVTVTAAPQKEWAMAAYGLPPEGAELALKVKAGAPFRLRAIDRTYGLPDSVPPRGPDMIIQPLGTSDSIQSVISVAFQ